MGSSYFLLTNQLNEVETRVVTSIVRHLENGEERVGIAQLAAENFVSTAFIIKMCKRLGYNGYTDLVYKLSQQKEMLPSRNAYELKTLIDNYSEADVMQFISYLRQFHNRKLFVVGAGFADIVAEYIAQRLAVSGFMVFNRVHFYDYMLFRNDNARPMQTNVEPAVIIAISQSGETDTVLNDVRRAAKRVPGGCLYETEGFHAGRAVRRDVCRGRGARIAYGHGTKRLLRQGDSRVRRIARRLFSRGTEPVTRSTAA